MIIFDRKKRFDYLIKNGFDKYPNKRDLFILAYEYKKQGLTNEEIKNLIIKFCKTNNSQFNYSKYESIICSILNDICDSDKDIKPNAISFSISELSSLRDINDTILEKVYFVLMCLAKYKNGNHIYLNNSSSISTDDIFNFAKVKTTKKNQLEILNELYNIGYIDISYKPLLKCDMLKIQVNKTNKDSVIEFYPNEDMVLEYLYFINKAIKCEECGCLCVKTNNKQKYCKECAKKIKNLKNKEYLVKKGK